MKTIAQQLRNGYTLSLQGNWCSHVGRVTSGGNVSLTNMEGSLEVTRLAALAQKRGVPLNDLVEEIIEAALFVGALRGIFAVQPYQHGDDAETTPPDDFVRAQLSAAAEAAGIES